MDTEPSDLLKTVKSPEFGERLLNHRRNKLIINTQGSYFYVDKAGNNHPLSGLLPRLRAVYWPTSNHYQQMKNAPKQQKQRGVVKKGKKKKGKKKGGGRFGGLIQGTQVHRELRDFVVLDEKNFKKNHRRLHPYSQRILKTIVTDMKWQPFLPEFDIFDERLGIGTSVDMICLDEQGKLILLEIKTGYKNYFESDDGQTMLQSLRSMRNTMQNQATCQITSAALILQNQYQVPLESMKLYIMRIDDESLDVIPIQGGFTKTVGPHIYRDLLNHNNTKNLQ